MKIIMKRACMLAAAAALVTPCMAKGAGTEAGVFMKLSAGARAVSMGEAYCAVADDVDGMAYNPGGITQTERVEVQVTHNEWLEGIQSEFAGIIYPLSPRTAIGSMVQYVHTDGIERRDVNGIASGDTFGYMGGVATVCMAHKIGPVSGGVSIKAVYEALDDASDTGYGCDAGILYTGENFKAGVMAGNFGQGIKLGTERFNLPAVAAAGIAYTPVTSVLISMDADQWLESGLTEFRAGGEYRFQEYLALRAGYRTGRDETAGPGISAGIGFGYGGYRLDYGFMPMGELGSGHRVTFAVSFGKSEPDPFASLLKGMW